jgi:hypothetical protein
MSTAKKESPKGVEAKAETQLPKTAIEFTKAGDFFSEYANNVQIQSSNWDVKLIFGELDQSVGPNCVIQKLAITVPWAQAKALAYFLSVHLLSHEMDLGRIKIPTGIIPFLPDQAPEGIDPKTWDQAVGLYKKFIADNPEAAPKK